jgi:hypothetical protein
MLLNIPLTVSNILFNFSAFGKYQISLSFNYNALKIKRLEWFKNLSKAEYLGSL